jgi:hypothetical protein
MSTDAASALLGPGLILFGLAVLALLCVLIARTVNGRG